MKRNVSIYRRSNLLKFWLLVLLWSPAGAETWTIEPGVGVGPLRFEMSRAEAERVLAPWRVEALQDYHSRGELEVEEGDLTLSFRYDRLQSITVRTAIMPSTRHEGEPRWLNANRVRIVQEPKVGGEGRTVEFICPDGLRVGQKLKGLPPDGYRRGMISAFNTAQPTKWSFLEDARRERRLEVDWNEKIRIITVADPSWFPDAEVPSSKLLPRWREAEWSDYFDVGAQLFRAYEREGRKEALQELISEILNDKERLSAALQRYSSRFNRGQYWNWYPSAVEMLNLMVEKGNTADRAILGMLLAPYSGAKALSQLEYLRGPRLIETTVPWVNVPEGAFLLAVDASLAAEPTHSRDYLFLPSPWGVRAFTLEGNPVTNILVPGELRQLLCHQRALWVATSQGIFRVEIGNWKTEKLDSARSDLVAHEGDLWYATPDAVCRYQVRTHRLLCYEPPESRLEKHHGRLVAISRRSGSQVWDPNLQRFRPFKVEPEVKSPPPAQIRLPNGAVFEKGKLTLPNGDVVSLLRRSETARIMADGDRIWASSSSGTLLLDPNQKTIERFPFPIPLGIGGTVDSSVYFMDPGGFLRFDNRARTFRWYSLPAHLRFASLGYLNGPVATLPSGQSLRFDPKLGTFQPVKLRGRARSIPKRPSEFRGKELSLLGGESRFQVSLGGAVCQSGPRGLAFIRMADASTALAVPNLKHTRVENIRLGRREITKRLAPAIASEDEFLAAITEKDPTIRALVLRLLPDGLFFPGMSMATRDPDSKVRRALASHLLTVADPESSSLWKTLSEDDDRLTRNTAVAALARSSILPSEVVVGKVLTDGDCPLSLAHLIVTRGSDAQLQHLLSAGRLRGQPIEMTRLGLLLEDRLEEHPDLADGLLERGRLELLEGQVASLAVTRGLKSDIPAVRKNALKLANRIISPTIETISAEADSIDELLQDCWSQPDTTKLQSILDLDPARAQDLLLSLLDSSSRYRFEFYAAEGLGHGPDRQSCCDALRPLADSPTWDIASRARVSLVRQGDPTYYKWVSDNLEQLGNQIFRLRGKDLQNLETSLLRLTGREDHRHTLSKLIARNPSAFTQFFYEQLAAQPEPYGRLLAINHLESAATLWTLAEDRDAKVRLASLVRLATRGDEEAKDKLKELAHSVRVSADQSQYEWFLPGILRLDDLGFLGDQTKDWLAAQYPTLMGESSELMQQFLRRIKAQSSEET